MVQAKASTLYIMLQGPGHITLQITGLHYVLLKGGPMKHNYMDFWLLCVTELSSVDFWQTPFCQYPISGSVNPSVDSGWSLAVTVLLRHAYDVV